MQKYSTIYPQIKTVIHTLVYFDRKLKLKKSYILCNNTEFKITSLNNLSPAIIDINIKTPIRNRTDRVYLSSPNELINNQSMKSQQKSITLSVEIDENIYQCMQDYLNSNSQWDIEAVLNASLSLFLMQNHASIQTADYRVCSQKYLRSICHTSRHYSQN